MTLITTAASSNAWADNEKPVDMHPMMFVNYEGVAPLTTILTRVSVGPKAKNVRIDWTEQERIPHRVANTGAEVAAGGTSVTIADYGCLVEGTLLFNPRTKELIRVDATPGTSTVDLTNGRGIGSSTAGTILAGEMLEVVANATEEGTELRDPIAVLNTNYYNYTQIINEFMRTTKSTNAETSEFYGPGGKRRENIDKLWYNFRVKMEKALMFGWRESLAADTLNFRAMGGLVEKLSAGTNVLTVDNVLTETAFDDWLTEIYTEMADASSLTLFGSPFLISKIQQICKPLIRISPNAKMYGVPQLTQYQGSVNLDLVRCPCSAAPS